MAELFNKRFKVPSNTWIDAKREHDGFKKSKGHDTWRHKQFLAQGGTCYYCDEPLNGARINEEHVIPKKHGGSIKDLVLACARCNKEKGNDYLSEKEREALRTKNKKKKGTYHLLKEQYPTEEEIALKISEFC